MNKQEQIKKIENKIEELKQEVEKLKNENKGRWLPEINEKYYFIDNFEDVIGNRYDNSSLDKRVMEYYRIFKTEEEAKHYRDYLKALKEATYEFTKEEWRNSYILKWYIYYNYEDKCLYCDYHMNYRAHNQIFFKTEEKARVFVSKWGKEIKEYEFDIYEEE